MTTWENRSRWYKIKFRLGWKYKTGIDRIYAALTRYTGIYNPEFQWNYYLWTMRKLQQAIMQYALKTQDKKLERFIGRVYLSYMKELNIRKPKNDTWHYYEYMANQHMIDSANIYAYYCLADDPEHRAQDAHMWLDIMFSHAMDMSI